MLSLVLSYSRIPLGRDWINAAGTKVIKRFHRTGKPVLMWVNVNPIYDPACFIRMTSELWQTGCQLPAQCGRTIAVSKQFKWYGADTYTCEPAESFESQLNVELAALAFGRDRKSMTPLLKEDPIALSDANVKLFVVNIPGYYYAGAFMPPICTRFTSVPSQYSGDWKEKNIEFFRHSVLPPPTDGGSRLGYLDHMPDCSYSNHNRLYDEIMSLAQLSLKINASANYLFACDVYVDSLEGHDRLGIAQSIHLRSFGDRCLCTACQIYTPSCVIYRCPFTKASMVSRISMDYHSVGVAAVAGHVVRSVLVDSYHHIVEFVEKIISTALGVFVDGIKNLFSEIWNFLTTEVVHCERLVQWVVRTLSDVCKFLLAVLFKCGMLGPVIIGLITFLVTESRVLSFVVILLLYTFSSNAAVIGAPSYDCPTGYIVHIDRKGLWYSSCDAQCRGVYSVLGDTSSLDHLPRHPVLKLSSRLFPLVASCREIANASVCDSIPYYECRYLDEIIRLIDTVGCDRIELISCKLRSDNSFTSSPGQFLSFAFLALFVVVLIVFIKYGPCRPYSRCPTSFSRESSPACVRRDTLLK